VVPQQVLGRVLAGAVRVGRPGRLVFADVAFAEAIHRPGRGEHDRDRRQTSQRSQQVEGAADVDLVVVQRRLERVPHPSQRGEMADALGSGLFDHPPHGRPVP
jgi:hypothetical protein